MEIKRSIGRQMFPLFFTIFLDVLGIGIAIPILAVIFLDPLQSVVPPETPLGVRTFLYGILIASYPIAQFFGAPILGTLSDQVGRKKLLLVALFGTFVGYLVFAIGVGTRNPWLLMASSLLAGFTGGNIPIAQSAIADLSTPENKTRNFGLMGVAFGLGIILGPYIGGKLSDPAIVPWFSVATPFLCAALLTATNIVLLRIFVVETLKVPIKAKINPLKGIHNLRRAFAPQMRVMFTVLFFITLGFNFFTQFFQVYLIEAFNFNPGQIGELFGFFGLCIVISQGLVLQTISHKYRPEQILWAALPLLAIAQATLLLPDEWPWLYGLIPGMALLQGFAMPSALAIVSNMLGKEEQGEGLGISQSVQSFGMAIPPIIAGLVVSLDRHLPIIISSVCILTAWLVFRFHFSPYNKQKTIV